MAMVSRLSRLPIMYLATVLLCSASFLVLHNSVASSNCFVDICYMPAFEHYCENNQYALLADSLISGRFDLDLPVDEALASLDNPYDYEARIAASEGGRHPIF